MRLFLQVANAIRARIESGTYPPGQRLPGNKALGIEFQCSTPTVSQALTLLAAEGLVDYIPQSGAWPVAGGPPARFPVEFGLIRRNARGNLMGAGTGDWAPVYPPEVLVVPCPAGVAALLTEGEDQVDDGELVAVRRRVVGPGYPVQSTDTYLPPWLEAELPVVAEADTGPGGWVERVEQDLQPSGPVSVHGRFITRPPTVDEVELFDLPPGVWVVEGRRRYTTSTGRPAGVDVALWDGRRVELVSEMRRDTSATWPVPPATMRNSPDP